jgi:hypothetical protein
MVGLEGNAEKTKYQSGGQHLNTETAGISPESLAQFKYLEITI